MTKILAPSSSLTNLTRSLFQFISNHPLIANPPILHPLTGEQVKIERYRLYDGLNTELGLTCSIFPFTGASGGTIPNPRTTSVSAMFDPYDIGQQGVDHAVYHIVVALFYNQVSIGNIIPSIVPDTGITHPDQLLLTPDINKSVNLEVNPGVEIIADYLELLRLIISDLEYKPLWPIPVNSFEAVYSLLNTADWEKDKNIYFQSGCLMTRLDAYVSRGWRDKFIQPLDDINVSVN